MPNKQINPHILKIILFIIALSSGPIGWIMILFWFIFKKSTDNSLQSFMAKNPKIFKDPQKIKTHLKFSPQKKNTDTPISPNHEQSDISNQIRIVIFVIAISIIILLIYLMTQNYELFNNL